MSDSTVIADASETLLKLLKESLAGIVAPDHVTLASPADIDLDNNPWLAIFLYQVAENHHLRDLGPERLSDDTMGYPPTVFDLYYLIIPYAATRETEYQILGRAMQTLAANRILKGARLQGSLEGTEEELHVRFHALSLEEMIRLWNSFNTKPYKLSIAYSLSFVKLDSTLAPLTIRPVVERLLRVEPNAG